MRPSHGCESGAGLDLPLIQEVGDGVRIHVAHVSKLRGLLRVDYLSVGVNNGESRNSLFERDVVFFGYVEVFVIVADVDMDEQIVLVEEL